jgi:hypothetical protein
MSGEANASTKPFFDEWSIQGFFNTIPRKAVVGDTGEMRHFLLSTSTRSDRFIDRQGALLK